MVSVGMSLSSLSNEAAPHTMAGTILRLRLVTIVVAEACKTLGGSPCQLTQLQSTLVWCSRHGQVHFYVLLSIKKVKKY